MRASVDKNWKMDCLILTKYSYGVSKEDQTLCYLSGCKSVVSEIADQIFLKVLIQRFLSDQNPSAVDSYLFLLSILLFLIEVYT